MKTRGNIRIVARREFQKIVRRPSFWFTTLAFPAFFFIVAAISALAGADLGETLEEQLEEAEAIAIVDEAGIIREETVFEPLEIADNRDQAVNDFKAENFEAVIVYPEDVSNTRELIVYEQDRGLFETNNYGELAQNLLQQNLLAEIATEDEAALIVGDTRIDTRAFDGDEPAEDTQELLGSYAIPGALVLVYFLLVVLAANYFVMSISEEKENRVIEIVLTIVKPTHLILGKIIGISGIASLQLLINGMFIFSVFLLFQEQIPIDITNIPVEYNTGQIALSLFYLITGFLLLAATMIAAGSIMPSAQEAGGLTSVFLLLTISPVWFFSMILVDPNGIVAIGTSYFPYTAPLILMLRNTLGELSGIEIVLSMTAMGIYVALVCHIAIKLFKIGAMEYNQKLSPAKLRRRWHSDSSL